MSAPDSAHTWQGKRVLVTGASGFLGQHLCAALLRSGAVVHATSRQPPTNIGYITWHRVNLSDRVAVGNIVAATAPAIVFHFSSLANARRDLSLVVPTFEAEVLSTLNLLLALHGRSVERLVLAASSEEPADDDVPSSPYAAAKATSRAYARMFHTLYDMPAILVRIFMSYGPGQPDWKLIPYVLRCLREGHSPQVASSDRAIDWIYVSDVVEGVLAVAAASAAVGRTVDVGSGQVATIRELAETIRRLTGSDVPIEYVAGTARTNEVERRANLAQMKQLCRWQPQVTLEQGLRHTIDAFASAALR